MTVHVRRQIREIPQPSVTVTTEEPKLCSQKTSMEHLLLSSQLGQAVKYKPSVSWYVISTGYAIVCSLVIDLVHFKWIKST
jgi:hypothetical protein